MRKLIVAGMVACVLLTALAALNLRWRLVGVRLGVFSVNVVGGAVMVDCTDSGTNKWYFSCDSYGKLDRSELWRKSGIQPVWVWDETIAFLSIPLWLPILATAALTTYLWWFYRRPAPGKCRCGYDLTGNTSGVCPECGTRIVTNRTEVG